MPRCQEIKVVPSLITVVEKSNIHKSWMELNLINGYWLSSFKYNKKN